MILKQYYLACLAHASYLLGDESSSTAIVVDPQRDSHTATIAPCLRGADNQHKQLKQGEDVSHRYFNIPLRCGFIVVTLSRWIAEQHHTRKASERSGSRFRVPFPSADKSASIPPFSFLKKCRDSSNGSDTISYAHLVSGAGL